MGRLLSSSTLIPNVVGNFNLKKEVNVSSENYCCLCIVSLLNQGKLTEHDCFEISLAIDRRVTKMPDVFFFHLNCGPNGLFSETGR